MESNIEFGRIVRYLILFVASFHLAMSANSEYTSCIIVCKISFVDICPSETPHLQNKRLEKPKKNCTELHKQCRNKCGFRKYCRGIKFSTPHCMGAYPNLRKAMMKNSKATGKTHQLLRRARNPSLKDILSTNSDELRR